MWTLNLREAQQRAKLAQARIQNFLEQQQEDLLKFLKEDVNGNIDKNEVKEEAKVHKSLKIKDKRRSKSSSEPSS